MLYRLPEKSTKLNVLKQSNHVMCESVNFKNGIIASGRQLWLPVSSKLVMCETTEKKVPSIHIT